MDTQTISRPELCEDHRAQLAELNQDTEVVDLAEQMITCNYVDVALNAMRGVTTPERLDLIYGDQCPICHISSTCDCGEEGCAEAWLPLALDGAQVEIGQQRALVVEETVTEGEG